MSLTMIWSTKCQVRPQSAKMVRCFPSPSISGRAFQLCASAMLHPSCAIKRDEPHVFGMECPTVPSSSTPKRVKLRETLRVPDAQANAWSREHNTGPALARILIFAASTRSSLRSRLKLRRRLQLIMASRHYSLGQSSTSSQDDDDHRSLTADELDLIRDGADGRDGACDDDYSTLSSDSSLFPDDIDFELVYALHTFVATVEGQANATKGDSMVLLDDSNSYWWLVRVVKDSSIGEPRYCLARHSLY